MSGSSFIDPGSIVLVTDITAALQKDTSDLTLLHV